MDIGGRRALEMALFTSCFFEADIARDMALNPLDEFDAFASDVHGFHRQTFRHLADIR